MGWGPHFITFWPLPFLEFVVVTCTFQARLVARVFIWLVSIDALGHTAAMWEAFLVGKMLLAALGPGVKVLQHAK